MAPLTRGVATMTIRWRHEGLARALRQLATLAEKIVLLNMSFWVLNVLLCTDALLLRISSVGLVALSLGLLSIGTAKSTDLFYSVFGRYSLVGLCSSWCWGETLLVGGRS